MPSLQIFHPSLIPFRAIARVLQRGMNVLWIIVATLGLASVVHAQEGTLDGGWRFALGADSYSGSSPALSPDGLTVYIGVETSLGRGRVLAISRDGGQKPIWSRDLPRFVYLSSPALSPDGRTLYIGCQDGGLYALDTASGAQKWTFDAGAFVTSSPAIGADGTIYFGGGDAKLHALIDQGNRAVERAGFPFTVGGPIESSPAIAPDGTIYFGSNDKNIYAVTSDGALKPGFPVATAGEVISSPAIGADGTIYVGSTDQRLYALAPDGTRRWPPFFTNGPIEASPTLGADGTIYIASFDRFLYALNPRGADDQRVKWKTFLNATASSTAAVRGDGVVILGVDGNRVMAFNPDTGAVRWEFDAPDDDLVESSPLIAPDGSIYIGFLDGFLYKLRGNGSPLSALSSWPAFRRDVQHTGRALTVTGGGKLVNLSIRAPLGGDDTLIVGFVVQSATGHVYLLRGVGPALAAFNVSGMPDPRISIFSGLTLIAGNDDWEVRDTNRGFPVAEVGAAVQAFPLPAASKDAALADFFPAGIYHAHVTSADGRGGVVLMEAYDTPAGDPALLGNVSTRGQVGVGENALFAGVVVGGTQPSRLLVRGVGPSLTQFGVPGALSRPTIALRRSGEPAVLRSNTVWASDGFRYDLEVAARAVAAFPLAASSLDSAMIVTIPPGAYTIQLSGVGDTTGEGLIEIYVLP